MPKLVGEAHEVGVGEFGAEVTAEALLLLPHDRAVLSVLPDDVDDRRAQPHGGLELLDVHQEAVAADRHDVASPATRAAAIAVGSAMPIPARPLAMNTVSGSTGGEHARDPQLV